MSIDFLTRRIGWGLLLAVFCFPSSHAWARDNLSSHLQRLQAEYQRHQSTQPNRPFAPTEQTVRLFNRRSVSVEMTLRQGLTFAQIGALQTRLSRLGMTHIVRFRHLLSGVLPIDRLPALNDFDEISWVSSSKATRRGFGPPGGSAYNGADAAMFTDVVRKRFGVDGSGVVIGVLSDSYDCLGGAVDDVSSGDLPPDVRVLKEYPFCEDGATDEGRAMLQLIHDIAPAAKLLFYTAFLGPVDFAQGIQALADAGAQVIVDDVGYLTMPFFQTDPIAQSVNEVKARGVSYFSSAGNSARLSYEQQWTAGNEFFSYDQAHDFGKAAGRASDYYQKVTLPPNQDIRITLQWDDPAEIVGGEGAKTDLDIFLLDQFKRRVVTSSQDNNIGHNPIEFIAFSHDSDVMDYYLYISHRAGPPPTRIKYILFGPTAPWPGGEAIIELSVSNTNGVFSLMMPDGSPIAGGQAAIQYYECSEGCIDVAMGSDLLVVGTPDRPIFMGPNGKPAIKYGDRIRDIGPGTENPIWFIPDGYSVVQGPNGLQLYKESEEYIPASIDQYPTYSGTVFGHPNAEGAMAVGAMPYHQTPWFGVPITQGKIQSFSSAGGTPILFDLDGKRLDRPLRWLKPDIVAPDEVNTTFFGEDTDLDGWPNFSGTSAAAPHAAALAALLLDAYPHLTPDQVYDAMRRGSLDLADPAQVEETPPDQHGCKPGAQVNWATGCGLVQADIVFDRIRLAGEQAYLTVTPMETEIQAGIEVVYRFRFSNLSPVTLRNVRFRANYFPEFMKIHRVDGCWDDPRNPGTCSVGDVAAGESVTIDVTATAVNNPTGELRLDIETLSDTPADLSQAHLKTTIEMRIRPGDLNHDGCVDRSDWGLLFGRYRTGGEVSAEYDLTGDGRLGVDDLAALESAYSNPPSGAACR